MKIAVYHNHYSKSSGEDVMFELQCEALQARGHEVLRVEAHVNEVLSRANKLELARMGMQAAHNTQSRKRAEAIVKTFKPDIAHVHNWFPMFSPAIYEAHFHEGIPVIQTLHNYRLGCATGNFRRNHEDCESCLTQGRKSALKHKCYQGSRVGSFFWKRAIDQNFKNGNFNFPLLHYVCPSQEVFRRHLKMGVSAERMTVVPNACRDPLDGGVIPERKELRVIYIGRLVPEKGVGILISAWEKMMNELGSACKTLAPKLSIVGEGSAESAFRKQADGVEGIEFHGYLAHDAVMKLLQSSSILVFPSVWAEPFGLGVIEGMAAGCAVIASDLGGPSGLVNHGETGFLFEAGNVNSLQARLHELIVSPDLRQRFARNGRVAYTGQYMPSAHAIQLEELYQSVL